MIRNLILMPLCAYIGAMVAMHQFNTGHAIMIIPSADGQFIAHDIDSERAKHDYESRVQGQARLLRQNSSARIGQQKIAARN